MRSSLSPSVRRAWAGIGVLALAVCAPAVQAGVFTWDGAPDGGGASADTLFTTGSNWVGDVAPNTSVGEGDDWIFDNTPDFPFIGSPVAGGRYHSITFTSNAPAFLLSGTDTANDLGNGVNSTIYQNSPSLQTLNVGLNVSGGGIKLAAGSGGMIQGADGAAYYLYSNSTAATEIDLGSDLTLGAGTHVARNRAWNIFAADGPASTPASVAGRFTLNGPAGTGTTANATNFIGSLHLFSGRIRVANSNALGATNTNAKIYVHGTFVPATTGQASGGFEHGFGTMELSGDITVAQRIRFDSRIGDVADYDHLVNVSGDNLLGAATGTFGLTQIGGAGHFNIASAAGTLTLAPNMDLHVSDGARSNNGPPGLINSVWTLRGAGIIDLQARLGQESGFSGAILGLEGTVVSALRKQGAGTLKLSNSGNDWDGGTWIDGGTVQVLAPGALSVLGAELVVASGAHLDVTAAGSLTLPTGTTLSGEGTVEGNVIVNGGGMAPGGTGGLDSSELLTVAQDAGTLTLSNDVDLSAGGVLKYDLSNNPVGLNDRLTIGGNLTLGGTVTLLVNALNGYLGSGTYRLVDYSGTLSDFGVSFLIVGVGGGQSRQTFAVDTTVPHQVNLVVSGSAGVLTWLGGLNNNAWDVATTVNWTGDAGLPPDNRFFDGDSVTFDSSGSNSPDINVMGTVFPGEVAFTNLAGHDYTLIGGNITPGGDFAVNGSGNLTFANANVAVGGNFVVNGSGDVTMANGDFAVAGSFAHHGSGTVTVANTGALASAGAIDIESGTLAINRAEPVLALNNIFAGAGTIRKEGANRLVLNTGSPAFTGAIDVTQGTLQPTMASALGAGGSPASGVTVANGAALDVWDLGGPNAPGGGVETVTISGSGETGLGALLTTQGSDAASAHVGAVVLAADARIAAIGIAEGRSILWVDGPFEGNGFNLDLWIDTSLNAGTELDFVGNGDMNVNNIQVGGGGVFYIGGDTTLGPISGTMTLNDAGRFGIYASAGSASTGVIDKPIFVPATPNGAGMEIYRGSKTVDSPVLMSGNFDVTMFVASSNNSNVIGTLTGQLTGTGALSVHLRGTSAASRVGTVQLTHDDNNYQGLTTIGGGGGLTAAPAEYDRITLQLGDGGTHGSIGPAEVVINAVGTLSINRSDTNVLANNLSGGGNVSIDGPGSIVTLAGSRGYAGETRVNAGTLRVDGLHTTGAAYAVADGATLDLTTTITPPLVLNGLRVSPNATFNFRLATPNSTTDDEISVNGELILVGPQPEPPDTWPLNINVTSLGGPELADGNYLLFSASTLTMNDVTPTLVYTGPSADKASLTISGPQIFLTIGTPVPPVLPPDIAPEGGDGFVDFADLGALLACFSGPEVPFAEGCDLADFDQDGDSDQLDFGIWQSCFAGSATPAAFPRCTHVQLP